MKTKAEKEAWVERVRAAMRTPYIRQKPRDEEEAKLLRERGTQEELIGPIRISGGGL